MNKDKLILKNNTIIELELGATLSDMRVLFASKGEMIDTWDVLTLENLSEVQVKNSEGLTVGNYSGLVLVRETSIIRDDSTILTSFCFREKTDAERKLDIFEEKLEIHDGALMDAAEILSNIVEAQEGGDT